VKCVVGEVGGVWEAKSVTSLGIPSLDGNHLCWSGARGAGLKACHFSSCLLARKGELTASYLLLYFQCEHMQVSRSGAIYRAWHGDQRKV
jgi:hypothetical protein